MVHSEVREHATLKTTVSRTTYCVFGVKPYHSGLKPEATPFALVTEGTIVEATLQEVTKGLITADLVIQSPGELVACCAIPRKPEASETTK